MELNKALCPPPLFHMAFSVLGTIVMLPFLVFPRNGKWDPKPIIREESIFNVLNT